MEVGGIRISHMFQSAPPVRAATNASGLLSGASLVSIRAAREGGDFHLAGLLGRALCFNPRRP